MQAKLILCFTTAESRVKSWASMINLSPLPPQWLRMLSILRRLVCCCVFIGYCCSHFVCVCRGVLGLCFVLQCFVSFLVLQAYQLVALLMLCFECHVAVIVL